MRPPTGVQCTDVYGASATHGPGATTEGDFMTPSSLSPWSHDGNICDHGVAHLNRYASGFVSALIHDTVDTFVDDVICVMDEFESDDDIEATAPAQAAPAPRAQSAGKGGGEGAGPRADEDSAASFCGQAGKAASTSQGSGALERSPSMSTLADGGSESEEDDDDILSISSWEEKDLIDDAPPEPYTRAAMSLVNWAVEGGFPEGSTDANGMSEMSLESVEMDFSAWAAGLEQQMMDEVEASLIEDAQTKWACNYICKLLDEEVRVVAKVQAIAANRQVEAKIQDTGLVSSSQATFQLDLATPLKQPVTPIVLPTHHIDDTGVSPATPRNHDTKSSKKELKRSKSGSALEASSSRTMAPTPTNSRSRRRIIGGVDRAVAGQQRRAGPGAALPQDQPELPSTEPRSPSAKDHAWQSMTVPASPKWMQPTSHSDFERVQSNSLASSRPSFRAGISALAMDLGEGALRAAASPQHRSRTPQGVSRSASLGALRVSKSQVPLDLVASPGSRTKAAFLPTLQARPGTITSSGSIAWSVHMAKSASWKNSAAGVF
mmetsp:Transcript_78925/g.223356  ORF Transcript_78925/g.223356 Transcript_78925/m.223356 type:complete len:549 (+) Transcript_78925:69-1715(+)